MVQGVPKNMGIESRLERRVWVLIFNIFTRLLERFAPISYLNCEHVLFVHILKQKQKKVTGFNVNDKIEFC